MTVLSRQDQLALVSEASRAPSVHNIQPARWRFVDDAVLLFRANDRVLPVADPWGHDVQVSLGAAFEGMSMALSTRGFALIAPAFAPIVESTAAAATCTPVARAAIQRPARATPDPLARYVHLRRAFRGKFERPSDADCSALSALARPDARIVARAALPRLARRHDDATWTFESRDAYHRELWNWLRLSPTHPRFHLDGLNADCLALSAVERWLGARLMEPRRFAWLAKLGIARALISEAAQVKSAAGAIVFCPLSSETPFDVGRRFYRLWLEAAALGLNLVPMSATADDESTRVLLATEIALPPSRRIANVFRVGRAAPGSVAESPRLPAHELLV